MTTIRKFLSWLYEPIRTRNPGMARVYVISVALLVTIIVLIGLIGYLLGWTNDDQTVVVQYMLAVVAVMAGGVALWNIHETRGIRLHTSEQLELARAQQDISQVQLEINRQQMEISYQQIEQTRLQNRLSYRPLLAFYLFTSEDIQVILDSGQVKEAIGLSDRGRAFLFTNSTSEKEQVLSCDYYGLIDNSADNIAVRVIAALYVHDTDSWYASTNTLGHMSSLEVDSLFFMPLDNSVKSISDLATHYKPDIDTSSAMISMFGTPVESIVFFESIDGSVYLIQDAYIMDDNSKLVKYGIGFMCLWPVVETYWRWPRED